MFALLENKGITLALSLEASTRAGRWLDYDNLQSLVSEASKDEDVAYIGLLDGKREVVVHSDPEQIGKVISSEVIAQVLSKGETLAGIVTDDGRKIFEVIRPFHLAGANQHGMMGRGRAVRVPSEDEYNIPEIIIIGLNTGKIYTAVVGARNQAILVSLVLLLTGGLGIYLILVTQSYNLVDRALKNMRSYTKSVLESMQNGVISVDEEGRIVTFNRSAERIYGFRESDIRGKPFSEIFKIESGDNGQKQSLLDTLHLGKIYTDQELWCYDKDGHKLPVSINTSLVKDEEGRNIGAVGVFRDLREIKALQERLRRADRLAAIGRLASGIAHEIRNPLGSIKGFAQILKGKLSSDEKNEKYIDIIVKETDRLNKVVSELLDFARPKEFKLKPIDINSLLRDIIALVEQDARLQNIKIVKDFTPSLNSLMLDEEQMKQALLNIILNGLQAMDEGGELRITTEIEDKEGGKYVNLIIADTGVGIDPENLDKLFDPFFTTKGRGTGLGLSIAHRIITEHQGLIEVESQRGKGSTFTIKIPLSPGDNGYEG